ncbi:hypothetical protein CK203_116502 [Vitis vinifera]|uniref:Uncharacterized protein n=1 Tax=Vitis vinifera TaxID=29760 RepID=A0A438CA10_VITVI|nr:hypothetical protein CK203_116502 [Vitis vinifera]
MSKTPNLVTRSHFFPSPRVFVPEKNPSSLLFTSFGSIRPCHRKSSRAQLSFSFLSAVGVSVIADLVALVFSRVQPPSIPKAPAKTSIDGIPFNAFPAKVIETSTLRFIVRELGWLPLANFTGSACAPIVRMFYSNIIEHDLDESYLQSSLFGIVVKVTPKIIAEVLGIPLVQAPSVSDLEITSDLLDRVSIDLWGEFIPPSHRANICKNGCILLSLSKKEVLPYGILITQICQRAGVVFPVNSPFLMPMGPIDTSSWNRRQGQIKGALVLRRRFDALDEKILLNPPYCLSRFLNSNLIWREASH